MALRTQLSLIFSDEDLYNNYVTVLKEQRELNNTVIKLLSAYYYRQDVRNLVDDINIEEFRGELETNNTKLQEDINAIRDSLLMQSFAAEELRQTLETGAQDINKIVEGTKKATASGQESASDAFGSGVVRIAAKNVISESPSRGIAFGVNTVPQAQQTVMNDVVLDVILQLLGTSKEQFNTLLNERLGGQVQQPVTSETVREEVKSEVVLSNISTDFDFSDPEPVVTEEPVKVDATDAMKDLLSSLGI